MNRIFFYLVALLLTIPAMLKAGEGDVIGTWLNADGTAHIRIFKATNGKYYGKIEWLKTDPERKDVNNPVESERSEPLMGLMILKSFQYDAEKKQWSEGTIYDPDNGKTYDCYMWLNDPNLLSIKGYVMGMKFIGRETEWKRVEE